MVNTVFKHLNNFVNCCACRTHTRFTKVKIVKSPVYQCQCKFSFSPQSLEGHIRSKGWTWSPYCQLSMYRFTCVINVSRVIHFSGWISLICEEMMIGMKIKTYFIRFKRKLMCVFLFSNSNKSASFSPVINYTVWE